MVQNMEFIARCWNEDNANRDKGKLQEYTEDKEKSCKGVEYEAK
jgi:hypothetical protein